MSDLRVTPAVMQGVLMLGGVALLGGIVSALGERPAAIGPTQPAVAEAEPPVPRKPPQALAEPLTPGMLAALGYASRRYRVSAEALAPIFAAIQAAARDLRLDPLLIVAVIGIESNFNPLAESVAGAQGLMQVIPRFHKDKLPKEGGKLHLFDPVTNIRVGTQALHEYIRRNGNVGGGLQQFAGYSGDPEQGYATRVLAEKERLEIAGRASSPAGLPESR